MIMKESIIESFDKFFLGKLMRCKETSKEKWINVASIPKCLGDTLEERLAKWQAYKDAGILILNKTDYKTESEVVNSLNKAYGKDTFIFVIREYNYGNLYNIELLVFWKDIILLSMKHLCSRHDEEFIDKLITQFDKEFLNQIIFSVPTNGSVTDIHGNRIHTFADIKHLILK